LFLTATVVFFLGAWEACFRLGLTDPYLYSAPSVIVGLLVNFSYLRTVIVFLFQVLLLASLGGVVGTLFGVFISRNQFLTRETISFAKTAVWVPFLLPWALPVWPVRPDALAVTILPIWFIGIVGVGLRVCLLYLIKHGLLNLPWRAIRLQLIRESLLQAAFISLISQVWMRPYGWNWFLHTPNHGAATGFAALLLLGLLQSLIYYIAPLKPDEDEQQSLHGTARLASSSGLVLWLLVLLVWQLLGLTKLARFISIPPLVFSEAYDLLRGASVGIPTDNTLWGHLMFSLFELLCGLTVATPVALLLRKGIEGSRRLKSVIEATITRGPLVVMVIPVFFVYWTPRVAVPLVAILGALFMALGPMTKGLRGGSGNSKSFTIVFAMRKALPFAFVGVLFGESIAGVRGIGFLMMTTLNYALPIEVPVGIFVVCILCFLVISFSLRFVPSVRESEG